VREQLEHDRVIRLLQAKYKRKYDVGINPGDERLVPAGTGPSAEYPDLVLHTSQRGRKLAAVIEVETGESVNHLEAMSQWVKFGRLRAPFYLYVPTASVDPARRMCADMKVAVAELWAYHQLGDQVRFTLVQRSPQAARAAAAAAGKKAKAPAPVRARKAPARKTAAKAAKKAPKGATKAAAKTARKAPAVARKAAGRKKAGAARARKSR